MKTFLINLDKDKDRLAAADAQLKKLGIAYERFPAVYGKEMPTAERRRCLARFHTYMAHGIIWSPGQMGCTLSHLFLYKKMIDENIPVAVIFEDDAQFSDDFPKALVAVEKFMDLNKSQVILFSDHSDNVNQRLEDCSGEVKVIPIPGDICSEGYLITLPAAKEIYRVNFPMVVMVDAWTRYRKRGHIELFRTEPPLVKQNRTDFVTGIQMPEPVTGMWRKLTWMVWRLFGHIVDELWFLLFRK